MARSDLALAALLLGGCDLVFGIDAEETPCELGAFGEGVDVIAAEDFSFDWEETFGVVVQSGAAYEMNPVDATLAPIDIGPYVNHGLALTPEGDALFYTIVVEPLTLKGALRGATSWRLDASVPRGTFAGTPSADVFGPRRVMVRMRAGSDEPVQEYEDISGVWTPVGDGRAMTTLRAPNLTPDGLTMVYAGVTETGEPGVFAEQRVSRSAAFGPPHQLLAGEVQAVQLLGRCQRMYTSDGTTLRRYDR